jgi:D-alanyl-D-alanine carboxypeptidase
VAAGCGRHRCHDASAHDVVRALWSGHVLATQQAELKDVVSMRSGKSIKTTSLTDPRGFGLGISQATVPTIGTIYDYEGGTLGYRALSFYLPKYGSIVTVALNSNADSKHDGINDLAKSILATLKRAGRL